MLKCLATIIVLFATLNVFADGGACQKNGKVLKVTGKDTAKACKDQGGTWKPKVEKADKEKSAGGGGW